MFQPAGRTFYIVELYPMQIEVDSHTHTVASGHAYSSLAENAQAAAASGIKLLAVTDHGPAMPDAPHPWYFINMRVIPRVIAGVSILRGIEANIVTPGGELDVEEDILQQMDIVLGSLHEPLFPPANRKKHTEAVIRAISSQKIDVFAHGGNPSFPIDVDEVARVASACNVLIEINNSSFTTSRSGSEKNCAALAEAVGNHGGLLTFGSDAHIADKVGGFEECVELVDRVGFPHERIVSCSADGFLEFLVEKRQRTTLKDAGLLPSAM